MPDRGETRYAARCAARKPGPGAYASGGARSAAEPITAVVCVSIAIRASCLQNDLSALWLCKAQQHDLEVFRVGTCEFRGALAEYVAANMPVATACHGQKMGRVVPSSRRSPDVDGRVDDVRQSTGLVGSVNAIWRESTLLWNGPVEVQP